MMTHDEYYRLALLLNTLLDNDGVEMHTYDMVHGVIPTRIELVPNYEFFSSYDKHSTGFMLIDTRGRRKIVLTRDCVFHEQGEA